MKAETRIRQAIKHLQDVHEGAIQAEEGAIQAEDCLSAYSSHIVMEALYWTLGDPEGEGFELWVSGCDRIDALETVDHDTN